MLVYTFRFDDVSLNTDTEKLQKMIAFLHSTFQPEQLRIILAVSPAVYDMDDCEKTLDRERAFPSIWHTESDYRIFYKMQRIGVPASIEVHRRNGAEIAGHGIVHVDHRLMKKSAQELSIVLTCSLLNSKIFVPPFHKWNRKTEAVCLEHSIELVKHSQNCTHLAYAAFSRRKTSYYMHTHDFSFEQFTSRFKDMQAV